MAFNINTMLAVINGVGNISKTSKFHVRIYRARQNSTARYVEFLCDAAQLPGISMQTDEIRHYGYGNVEKRPYSPIFTDVNTSFLCDSDGRVFDYFHKWMQTIYNFNPQAGTSRAAFTRVKQNLFSYPAEYYSQIEISHFDETGEYIITYILHDAYPISVADIPVAWENENVLTRLPVTFAFNTWEAETLDPGIINERLNARFAALNYAATRIDYGLALTHGLQILNTPTNPLTVLGAVNTLASRL